MICLRSNSFEYYWNCTPQSVIEKAFPQMTKCDLNALQNPCAVTTEGYVILAVIALVSLLLAYRLVKVIRRDQLEKKQG